MTEAKKGLQTMKEPQGSIKPLKPLVHKHRTAVKPFCRMLGTDLEETIRDQYLQRVFSRWSMLSLFFMEEHRQEDSPVMVNQIHQWSPEILFNILVKTGDAGLEKDPKGFSVFRTVNLPQKAGLDKEAKPGTSKTVGVEAGRRETVQPEGGAIDAGNSLKPGKILRSAGAERRTDGHRSIGRRDTGKWIASLAGFGGTGNGTTEMTRLEKGVILGTDREDPYWAELESGPVQRTAWRQADPVWTGSFTKGNRHRRNGDQLNGHLGSRIFTRISNTTNSIWNSMLNRQGGTTVLGHFPINPAFGLRDGEISFREGGEGSAAGAERPGSLRRPEGAAVRRMAGTAAQERTGLGSQAGRPVRGNAAGNRRIRQDDGLMRGIGGFEPPAAAMSQRRGIQPQMGSGNARRRDEFHRTGTGYGAERNANGTFSDTAVFRADGNEESATKDGVQDGNRNAPTAADGIRKDRSKVYGNGGDVPAVSAMGAGFRKGTGTTTTPTADGPGYNGTEETSRQGEGSRKLRSTDRVVPSVPYHHVSSDMSSEPNADTDEFPAESGRTDGSSDESEGKRRTYSDILYKNLGRRIFEKIQASPGIRGTDISFLENNGEPGSAGAVPIDSVGAGAVGAIRAVGAAGIGAVAALTASRRAGRLGLGIGIAVGKSSEEYPGSIGRNPGTSIRSDGAGFWRNYRTFPTGNQPTADIGSMNTAQPGADLGMIGGNNVSPLVYSTEGSKEREENPTNRAKVGSVGRKETTGNRSMGNKEPIGSKESTGRIEPMGRKEPIGGKEPIGSREPMGNKEPIGSKESIGSKEPVGSKEPIGSREIMSNKETIGNKETISNNEIISYKNIIRNRETISNNELIRNREIDKNSMNAGNSVNPENRGNEGSSQVNGSRSNALGDMAASRPGFDIQESRDQGLMLARRGEQSSYAAYRSGIHSAAGRDGSRMAEYFQGEEFLQPDLDAIEDIELASETIRLKYGSVRKTNLGRRIFSRLSGIARSLADNISISLFHRGYLNYSPVETYYSLTGVEPGRQEGTGGADAAGEGRTGRIGRPDSRFFTAGPRRQEREATGDAGYLTGRIHSVFRKGSDRNGAVPQDRHAASASNRDNSLPASSGLTGAERTVLYGRHPADSRFGRTAGITGNKLPSRLIRSVLKVLMEHPAEQYIRLQERVARMAGGNPVLSEEEERMLENNPASSFSGFKTELVHSLDLLDGKIPSGPFSKVADSGSIPAAPAYREVPSRLATGRRIFRMYRDGRFKLLLRENEEKLEKFQKTITGTISREAIINRSEIHRSEHRLLKDNSQLVLSSRIIPRKPEEAQDMIILAPAVAVQEPAGAYARNLPPITHKEEEAADKRTPQKEPVMKSLNTPVDSWNKTVHRTITEVELMNPTELNRLVDKVYDQLETRLARERRRYGL